MVSKLCEVKVIVGGTFGYVKVIVGVFLLARPFLGALLLY